jgi:uracil-DNA glycosylase family 4
MDWGSVKVFTDRRHPGKDAPENKTNQGVVILFKEIGYDDIDVPDGKTYGRKSEKDGGLFFTNVVHCLRTDDKMQGNICQRIANDCARKFTKELIDIIRPKVVIALGQVASVAIASCYNLVDSMPKEWKDVVAKGPFMLFDDVRMFPVYHCGAAGRISREMELQKKDWKKIKDYLQQQEQA